MLLCGAAFTACSHHEASFDEGYQAKSKALQREAQYQDAFVKAFGPIASGHQWGFDQTAVAGTRAGMAEADDFSGWSVPNDLTSFKEGSKTAKASLIGHSIIQLLPLGVIMKIRLTQTLI